MPHIVTRRLMSPEDREDMFGFDSCKVGLLCDGAVASWAWVEGMGVRIGSDTVRMGGLRFVGTADEYRGRGYSRRVMAEALAYMDEQQFAIAGTSGAIGGFYERFGYAVTIPEYALRVAADALSEARIRHEAVDFEGDDTHVDAMRRIYNQNNHARTGSLVRPEPGWPWRSKYGYFAETCSLWDAKSRVLLDPDGTVCGYTTFHQGADDVPGLSREDSRRPGMSELGYATPDLFETFVALLHEDARERGEDTIENWWMPVDHPFALYLRRYGCDIQTRYQTTGGSMHRIVNVRRLFSQGAPTLSARMRSSQLRAWRGSIAFTTDIGDVTLTAADGRVSIEDRAIGDADHRLDIPQNRLIQVLFGVRDIATFAPEDGVSLTPGADVILRVLCPSGAPFIWRNDRF